MQALPRILGISLSNRHSLVCGKMLKEQRGEELPLLSTPRAQHVHT